MTKVRVAFLRGRFGIGAKRVFANRPSWYSESDVVGSAGRPVRRLYAVTVPTDARTDDEVLADAIAVCWEHGWTLRASATDEIVWTP